MSRKHYILVGRTSDAIARGIMREFGGKAELKIDYPTSVIQSRFGTFGDGESIFELFVDGKLPDHPIEQNLSEGEKRDVEKDFKGADLTIVHSISGDHTTSRAMSLLDGVYDLKNEYGANSVSVIAPHLPFMRNDRRFRKGIGSQAIYQRNAISGMNYARRLASEGADRIVGFDPHSRDGVEYYRQYFNNQAKFLRVSPIIAETFKKDHGIIDIKGNWNVAVGSPDGLNKPDDYGIARAKKTALYMYRGTEYGRYLMRNSIQEIPFMFGIAKERINDKETRIVEFSGNVRGKHGLIIDDIYSSGGTTIQAARRLKDEGAVKCSSYATHGVLTSGAIERFLKDDSLDQVYLSDSIPSAVEKIERAGLGSNSKFPIISLADPIVEEIKNIKAALSLQP